MRPAAIAFLLPALLAASGKPSQRVTDAVAADPVQALEGTWRFVSAARDGEVAFAEEADPPERLVVRGGLGRAAVGRLAEPLVWKFTRPDRSGTGGDVDVIYEGKMWRGATVAGIYRREGGR